MEYVDEVLDAHLERVEQRGAVVGIIGLGYVGLPLAVAFAEAGFRVIGLDVDPRRVREVNAGVCPIQDVDAAALAALVGAGTLRATLDDSELDVVDTVSICVPTPVHDTKAPDLSHVLDAVEKVKAHLHPGQLVVLESTTFPGTTTDVVLPLLEETGLRAGEDFYLAFSPERIDPGNPTYGLKNTPKIVGGVTPKCAAYTSALYRTIADEITVVSSPLAAELTKLLENTFRAVNIGLAAEFASIADRLGADIWEIIEAAATKPFGFMPFYPGPGVGGHCIPVDPHYLLWKLDDLGHPAPLVRSGMEAIEAMPRFVVSQVERALDERGVALEGARVVVLGVAYKRDIADVRESPALDVLALLLQRGAEVTYVDAHVPEVRVAARTLYAANLRDLDLSACDCVVITTDHSGVDYAMVVREAPVVVDTRNVTRGIEEADGVWRLVRPSRLGARAMASAVGSAVAVGSGQ